MYLGASRTFPFGVVNSDRETRKYATICYGRLGQGDSGNNSEGIKCSGNVPASWRIYTKSRSFQNSIGKPWELKAHA
jgi:hypothetical protein